MILDELSDYARERVCKAKRKLSLPEIKNAALSLPKWDFRFENTLKKKGLSFICEVKKASPSKGVIDPVFDYTAIARDYENIGVDCLSCLTEPKWFLGSDDIFKEIRKTISLPMLRKDFMVDEYQIYEAKLMGADAVLLICAILDTAEIARYLEICTTLGITALVETHNEEEVKSAVNANARVIGVNNRNLKDFSVNIKNAASLREKVPSDILFVAESGINDPADIKELKSFGVDGVLIGEAMMRAADKRALLNAFREASI